MNNDYVPFLKLKVNEIGALKALDPAIKEKMSPFFDLPKKKDMSEDQLRTLITKAAKSATKNLTGFNGFYLDNFDIDDGLPIDGDHNYAFIISEFSDLSFVPVVGLDRTPRRNALVFSGKDSGQIKSDRIAIRLMSDDFENYDLVAQEIEELIEEGSKRFSQWELIFDNRYCANTDVAKRSQSISNFIKKAKASLDIERLIVTGSSIPASIGEIISTEDDLNHPRTELSIFKSVKKLAPSHQILFGDYTIVSPLYSDLNIPANAMRNVTTAKITYTYGDVHYISRGGSLRTHARGDKQYNDIAKEITGLHFYRGAPYSFGDNFIEEKAGFVGSAVTPSSILKPTINLHITYMVNGFVL